MLLALAPGDPLDMMLANAPQRAGVDIAALRHAYGLDQPIPVRYVKWLQHVAHGDLGWSIEYHTPVAALIAQRFPKTLLLMGSGFLVSMVIGIPVGIYSALHQYSILDYGASLFSFFGFSVPIFWLGLSLIYVFSIRFHLLPAGGFQSTSELTGFGAVGDQLRHLVLPMAVIALYNMAALMRYSRSAMLEVIHQDYMRTAEAKGLTRYVVIYRHGLRNALVPVVTILALILPALFGGAPVTETVFSWPGIGELLIQSVLAGDLVVAQGVLLVLSVLVIVANLLADITYALLDPRIRFS